MRRSAPRRRAPNPAGIREDLGFKGWVQELEDRGVMRGGERLRPSADATTVRVRDDDVLTSDGPFAESKEVVGDGCYGVSVFAP